MTRALPFTQASLCRQIKAAQKAGLRVIGIRPDGTVVVHDGSEPIADIASVNEDDMRSKWEDVKA
ncbi:MAG: hypothetical protein WBG18_19740 [Xanthobacteraceae bacterium]